MKYVIIGRSGTGKSTLAQMLHEVGFSVLKTCTDRPKRRPDEDDYHFLTKEQADAIPAEEKILETVLDGYRRFTTVSAVREAKIMILDPKGLYEIADLYPEETFGIIHASAYGPQAREHAMYRQDNMEKALAEFDSRRKDETAMFDAFELILNKASAEKNETIDGLPANVVPFFQYDCGFTPETLMRDAHILSARILKEAFGQNITIR